MSESLHQDLTELAGRARVTPLDLASVRRVAAARRRRRGLAIAALAAAAVVLPVWLLPGSADPRDQLASGSTGAGDPSSSAVPAAPSAVGPLPADQGRGGPPPLPAPCPADTSIPSDSTGSFCGPAPRQGNGLGPDGTCTGRESVPPCGPGVVVGQYYPYTVPVGCLLHLDGREWWSLLPTPAGGPVLPVWIRVEASGSAGWIGPGAVGLVPRTAATPTCPAR